MDAAWKSNPSTTGLSAILKYWNGHLLGVFARFFFYLYFDPPLAEILAIREGLKFAAAKKFENLMVESDCLQTIRLLDNEDEELRGADGWLDNKTFVLCLLPTN